MIRIRIHVPDSVAALGMLAGLALAAVGLAWLLVTVSATGAHSASHSRPAPTCLGMARLLHVPAAQARQACHRH